MTKRPRLAVTMGDPAGVGPEVVAKAMPVEIERNRSTPIVVGDARWLARELARYAPNWFVRSVATPDEADDAIAHTVAVLDLANCDPARTDLGEVDAYTGEAAFQYVTTASALAMDGEVDAIVTAPLNKEAMHLAGHKFDGHTGLLGHLTGAKRYFMVLGSERLKVIHISTHISLEEAVKRVKRDRIAECVRAGHQHMKQLGVAAPRIAVCGLNPHAGEHRLFGNEDEDEIRPAVADVVAEGVNAEGPLPADSCVRQAYEGQFDLVVVMYHDQGHVPMKLVAFAEGVNVTVGLPIIRTSVDHGTAFDIAGKGIADPTNMGSALDYAYKLAVNR